MSSILRKVVSKKICKLLFWLINGRLSFVGLENIFMWFFVLHKMSGLIKQLIKRSGKKNFFFDILNIFNKQLETKDSKGNKIVSVI